MIDIHKIRIITLCDNGASNTACIGEWGLSLHLCHENEPDVLLDTGKGMSCVPNATALGVDLGRLETICLSHGHSDQTGGPLPLLKTIAQTNPSGKKVGVYCHPAALEEQYVSHGDGYFYCGIPCHLEELRRYGANFRTSSKPVWINANEFNCKLHEALKCRPDLNSASAAGARDGFSNRKRGERRIIHG